VTKKVEIYDVSIKTEILKTKEALPNRRKANVTKHKKAPAKMSWCVVVWYEGVS